MGRKRKSKPSIFDDNNDDNNNDDSGFNINKKYAASYTKRKQFQEIQNLRDKYGNNLADEDDESSLSSSETEDSEAMLDTPEKDIKFLQVLPLIQKKHPAVMKADKKFFANVNGDETAAADGDDTQQSSSSRHKPVRLNDYVRSQLLEHGSKALLSDSEDDDAPARTTTDTSSLPYAGEQEALKREFLDAFEASTNVANDNANDTDDKNIGGFLKKRKNLSDDNETNTAPKLDKVAETLPTDDGIHMLKSYWQAEDVDDSDKFLRDFIVNKRWVDPNAKVLPSYDEIVGDSDSSGSDVLAEDQLGLMKKFEDIDSDDDSDVENQEQFEAQYNFRFEEPGGTEIITHPRPSDPTLAESSARRKDARRTARRQRRLERKKSIEAQRREAAKRLKALARKELARKVAKLREIADLEVEAQRQAAQDASDDASEDDVDLKKEEHMDPTATLTLDDLDGEFDPETHDKRMKELFGDEFYNKLQRDTTKPVFPDDDEDDPELAALLAADNNNDDDDDDDDDDKTDKNDKTSKKKSKKKKLDTEALAAARQKLEGEVQTKLGEYYDLDYEDVIGGEIKTRFKYTEVEPLDFGLDAIEVLKFSDKDLNQLVGLKSIAPYKDVRKLKKSNWEWRKMNWLKERRHRMRAEQQGYDAQEADYDKVDAADDGDDSKKSKKKRKRDDASLDNQPSNSDTDSHKSAAKKAKKEKKKEKKAKKDKKDKKEKKAKKEKKNKKN